MLNFHLICIEEGIYDNFWRTETPGDYTGDPDIAALTKLPFQIQLVAGVGDAG